MQKLYKPYIYCIEAKFLYVPAYRELVSGPVCSHGTLSWLISVDQAYCPEGD